MHSSLPLAKFGFRDTTLTSRTQVAPLRQSRNLGLPGSGYKVLRLREVSVLPHRRLGGRGAEWEGEGESRELQKLGEINSRGEEPIQNSLHCFNWGDESAFNQPNLISPPTAAC